jgi:hypothetical protein
MIRTLCVVGAALSISAGPAGVALAAEDTGPGSHACSVAKDATEKAQSNLNRAVTRNGNQPNDENRKLVDELTKDLQTAQRNERNACGSDHDNDHWGDNHGSGWDRDHHYTGPLGHRNAPVIVVADCDNDKALQLRYRNDWRGVADRYTLTLREARSEHSDGGSRVTDSEKRRIRDSYDLYNNHRSLWLSATSKRKLDCKDDGGDTTVINVEQPPAEITYTVSASSVKTSVAASSSNGSSSNGSSTSSGGQVSVVPSGSVDTGDGSTEV